jgi:hypothetical protein
MKELHLGKMNNKELAEWFGITEGSFRTSKKKKLEELKYFANFEEVGKKIEIFEIKDPIYSK